MGLVFTNWFSMFK